MLNRTCQFFRGAARYFFRYDETIFSAAFFREELFEIPQDPVHVFKHSKSCFAAEWKIPGMAESIFYKRNPRKNWKYLLRYLFQKPRVFRAAKVTEHLLKAGIPTPDVYFCGMKRKFFLPVCGCSASEFLRGAVPVDTLMKEASTLEEILQITERAARLLAEIHRSGVYHGDFKLFNLYELDGKFGVIDLDGSIIFRKGVPFSYRKKDLIRLAVAVVHCKGDDFSLLPDLCRVILSSGGTAWDAEELSSGVKRFFQRKPPK